MTDESVHFRTAYDGLAKPISDLTSLSEFEDTLTQQHMAADCDINTIIERWASTGILSHTPSSTPSYGDFTDVKDLHTALNIVQEAQDMFAELPAKIRSRFDNDPVKYVDFVMNPENHAEAIELGILDSQGLSIGGSERAPTDAGAEPPVGKPGKGSSTPPAPKKTDPE